MIKCWFSGCLRLLPDYLSHAEARRTPLMFTSIMLPLGCLILSHAQTRSRFLQRIILDVCLLSLPLNTRVYMCTCLQELRLTFWSVGISTVAHAQLMQGSVNMASQRGDLHLCLLNIHVSGWRCLFITEVLGCQDAGKEGLWRPGLSHKRWPHPPLVLCLWNWPNKWIPEGSVLVSP